MFRANILSREIVRLPIVAVPPIKHGILVCNLEISSYMADHADFVSFFIRNQAHQLLLPTSESISLPTVTNVYHAIKGPFVHAKTKEVYKQFAHTRLLQIFDTHSETVDEFIKLINKKLPPGVNMKTERFERLDLDQIATLKDDVLDIHKEMVLARANELIAKFEKKEAWDLRTKSRAKEVDNKEGATEA